MHTISDAQEAERVNFGNKRKKEEEAEAMFQTEHKKRHRERELFEKREMNHRLKSYRDDTVLPRPLKFRAAVIKHLLAKKRSKH